MMIWRPFYMLAIHLTDNLQAQAMASWLLFLAPHRIVVNKCHKLLIINGGANEGDPGPRPHYSDCGYYAYGRDLDGNKLLFYCDAKDHT